MVAGNAPGAVAAPVGVSPRNRGRQTYIDLISRMAVHLHGGKVVGFIGIGASMNLRLPAECSEGHDAVVQGNATVKITSRPSGSVFDKCFLRSAYRCRLLEPTRHRHGCVLCTDGARVASDKTV